MFEVQRRCKVTEFSIGGDVFLNSGVVSAFGIEILASFTQYYSI
jgi:hypothetical protein